MINLDEIYVGDIVKWNVGRDAAWFVLAVGGFSDTLYTKSTLRYITVIDEHGSIKENAFLVVWSGCTIWHGEELPGRERAMNELLRREESNESIESLSTGKYSF